MRGNTLPSADGDGNRSALLTNSHPLWRHDSALLIVFQPDGEPERHRDGNAGCERSECTLQGGAVLRAAGGNNPFYQQALVAHTRRARTPEGTNNSAATLKVRTEMNFISSFSVNDGIMRTISHSACGLKGIGIRGAREYEMRK